METSLLDGKTEVDGVEEKLYSMKELEGIIGDPNNELHTNFRDEFLSNEVAFLEKYLEKDSNKKDSDEVPQEQKLEEKPEEKTEETDKNLLHTYKSLEEMSKGITEKDKYIKLLEESTRKDLGLLQEDKKSLKRQIEELQNKSKDEKKEDKRLSIPEISDDDDIFDENYQKGIRKTLEDVIKEHEELKSKYSKLEDTLTETAKQTAERKRKEAISLEISEVDNMRKNATDIFKSTRSLEEIEGDYLTFMERIKRVAGKTNEPTYLENGKFTPTMDKLYDDYMRGGEFTELCKENSVVLPEDFDDLKTVDAIRKIRQTYGKRDVTGNYKELDYQKALTIYRQENTDINKIKSESRIEGRKDRIKAIENRGQFVPETKASDGANPIDLNTIKVDEFKRIMDKGRLRTESETKWLRDVMSKQDISDAEINDLLKT